MPQHSQSPTSLERIRGRFIKAVGRMPAGYARVLLRVAGKRQATAEGQVLDPVVQLAIEFQGEEPETPLLLKDHLAARAKLRREVLSIQSKPTPVGLVRPLQVKGASGPLAARLYLPERSGSADPPLTVFYHGGGFVSGDLDTHDEPCRIICARAGHVVLSVDYRLAPEHPFPAAYDDALAAFQWAQRHASRLGADASRVAVGGDSAGGNLAAYVSQACRDEAPPRAQLLVYPVTDSAATYPSRQTFDGYLLSERQRCAYHSLHTSGTGAEDSDARLSPMRGDMDRPLAPALVTIAGFDVLRDEAEAYADVLESAGTTVEVLREPALPHGYINLTGFSRIARKATEHTAERWSRLLLNVAP